MTRTIWGLSTVLLATTGWAQPVKKPAKAPDAAGSAGTAAASAPATTTAEASAPPAARETKPTVTIAPPEEPGWTVVEVPGGYYRYRSEPDEQPGEGGVTVVASEPQPGAMAPRQPSSAAMGTQAQAAGANAGAAAAPAENAPPAVDCENERGLLNQRLWELRGVSLDPASANALSDAERPLMPSAWGFVPGLGPGLASFLPTAAQYDSPTRERLAEFAKCVERAQGR